MSALKDYSQYGEQAAILSAVAETMKDQKEPGRFLDIGAWHPTEFSNTRALYEFGWFGVMIEPSPGPMLNLLEAYGADQRIVLIAAAVSVDGGLAGMNVTDDAVSTSVIAEYDRWKDAAKFRGRVWVPTISLEELAIRYGGFDFVNIDAEGQSADLFLRMIQLGLFPHCVCVEHESRTTELLTAATAASYRCVLANSTNLVLAR